MKGKGYKRQKKQDLWDISELHTVEEKHNCNGIRRMERRKKGLEEYLKEKIFSTNDKSQENDFEKFNQEIA